MTVFTVCDGTARRDNYVAVKGKVIDEIPVTQTEMVHSYEAMMPQISYVINDSTYYFVDRNAPMKVGSEPTIFYRKDDPQDAQIYTIRFWFNPSVIVPAFWISWFVFCIILISITKYQNKGITLKGHFDNDEE